MGENSENNSVNIYLRIRPSKISESTSPAKSYMDINSSSSSMVVIENKPYVFDNVFYSASTQEEIFQIIEPSIEKLLEGFNSCTCAYGQSGAGKTYTMGLNEKNSAGMVILSIDSLFNKLVAMNQPEDPIEFEVNISYIEIYNDKVYDLLNDKHHDSIYSKGSKYAGSTKVTIENSDDAKELLATGNKSRHTRSTVINDTSSRSHAIFSIFLDLRSANKGIKSVFHLVDLAGSEGLRNTNHEGIAQQEGININQGLLAVRQVIHALSNGSKLVPYRQNVLTCVLQDCLNSDSFLSLIACVSPTRKDRNETLSTIKFAQSCKALESKLIPEVNTYLKQKQRLQARTPLKSYMFPLARNEMTKTPGKALAKTPGKALAKTPGKVLAKTPSKITAAVNRATGTIKKQPTAILGHFYSFNTPSKRFTAAAAPARYSEFPHASDISYAPKESIDNTLFNHMNVSSSTEVEEGTSITTNPSLNHLAQPPSFSPLMRQIESTIDKKFTLFFNSFINKTTNRAEIEDEVQSLKTDIQDAVLNGINETRNVSETGNDDSTFIVPESAACSTVARQPNPSITIKNENQIAGRTNRRLMTHDFVGSSPLRLSDSHNESTTEDQTVVVRQVQRRSIRISKMKEIRQSKEKSMPKIEEKVRKSSIKNKIVASYLNSTVNLNITKKDHKSAVLELMNTGSSKEIQVLPGLGAKKAFCIVSHRAVNGKFKNFEQVKKALGMTPKSWNTFAEKNLLK